MGAVTYTTLGALAAVIAYGAGYLVLTGVLRSLTQARETSLMWVDFWRTPLRMSGRTWVLPAALGSVSLAQDGR